MSSKYFNSLRSERSVVERNRTLSKSQNGGGKREKLKKLIKEKMMKKYKMTNLPENLEREIDLFISCDHLSEKDLKILDSRIQKLLNEKTNKSVDVNTVLKNENKEENRVSCTENNEVKTNNQKERNIMSGASHLNEMFPNQKNVLNRNDPEVPEEELIKPKKRTHRFEYEHEEDMWNAFNNVNRRIFEQERTEEKIKEKEIKRRTKEDLDNQIKQKLLRLDDQKKKDSEYHGILVNHIDYLNKLEDDKQKSIKDKILREKENRDKQMWDNNYRKKVEKIKQRKYENNLLEYIAGEIKNEKDAAIKKKVEAIEALQKTLIENEENRKLRERLKQEEAEDEMKTNNEYNNIVKKQEKDRANYFKNIEMKSTDFMAKMTETVLKQLKDKNDKAEEKMNEFLKKKELESIQKEKDEMMRRKEQKKELKKFLDKQLVEKQKLLDFEKEVDNDMADIIKQDFKLYEEYKKDAAEKVRNFYLDKSNEYEQCKISKRTN